YDERLLATLTDRVEQPYPTESRQTALRLIAALHHKVPDWDCSWWAYHPTLADPPAKSVAWAGTQKVLSVLENCVGSEGPSLRLDALDGLEEASATNSAALLRSQFERETEPAVRRIIIELLGNFRDEKFSYSLSRL